MEANARVAARGEGMANNQTLSFVTVREGGVRILPSQDNRYLSRNS
ncbi:MAG: hypothetical protein R3C56_32885 [Pirellulaceae bacterium]